VNSWSTIQVEIRPEAHGHLQQRRNIPVRLWKETGDWSNRYWGQCPHAATTRTRVGGKNEWYASPIEEDDDHLTQQRKGEKKGRRRRSDIQPLGERCWKHPTVRAGGQRLPDSGGTARLSVKSPWRRGNSENLHLCLGVSCPVKNHQTSQSRCRFGKFHTHRSLSEEEGGIKIERGRNSRGQVGNARDHAAWPGTLGKEEKKGQNLFSEGGIENSG